MSKLLKFLKPFTLFIAAAVAFLFMQVFFDLRLPDYMSNIVNVGIQQGGVTEASPKAITEDSMQLLLFFMSDDEVATVSAAYTLVTPTTATAEEIVLYPVLAEKNIYVLSQDFENMHELDTAFRNATSTILSIAQVYMETNGAQGSLPNASQAESVSAFDFSLLHSLAPMLQSLPADVLVQARAEALQSPENIRHSINSVFVHSAYTELGMDTEAIQTGYIMQTGIKMLSMSALSVLTSVAVGYIASKVGTGFARSLRSALFHKVESFSNQEFDKFSTASLITRTTNDVTQMQQVITMGIRMLASAPIMGIGGAVMAWQKSPSMAWLIALAIIIISGFIFLLYLIAMPKFKIMQQLIDRLNLVALENLSGVLVIRAFSTQIFEENRFDEANKNLTSTNLFVARSTGFMMPIMNLIMNGLTIAVVWIGAQQIAASTMQVGDMMAFMQYAMQIIMSFFMISMMFIMIPRAAVSADRIAEVLGTEPSVLDPEVPVAFTPSKDSSISFNNVSFRYPGAPENALDAISFEVPMGKTIAIIGSTGAGKSTLANLLMRFYDVTSGEILLGGENIKNYTQHDLRKHIGFVPQQTTLFSGTVASNILYGAEEDSEETLHKAANIAQASEFVEKMPKQYTSEIAQGGTNVSGGQRQRLAIARALAKDAPIYIFDDSFSALDFKTDVALRRALNRETGDSSIIIIAQRINTIMQADEIVVLNEGRIAGKGTHTELLETCDTYREIALSQLSEEELA